MTPHKLYIVLSSAIDSGAKIAQAVHAAYLFGEQYPHLQSYWYRESNNIVCLQTDDIRSLADKLEVESIRISRFEEPDRDNELTAIAVEPAGWKKLSSLPLAR